MKDISIAVEATISCDYKYLFDNYLKDEVRSFIRCKQSWLTEIYGYQILGFTDMAKKEIAELKKWLNRNCPMLHTGDKVVVDIHTVNQSEKFCFCDFSYHTIVISVYYNGELIFMENCENKKPPQKFWKLFSETDKEHILTAFIQVQTEINSIIDSCLSKLQKLDLKKSEIVGSGCCCDRITVADEIKKLKKCRFKI